jgi:hypothetical protein
LLYAILSRLQWDLDNTIFRWSFEEEANTSSGRKTIAGNATGGWYVSLDLIKRTTHILQVVAWTIHLQSWN